VSLTRKNPSPNLPQTRVGLPFVPVNNISIYQINRLRPYTLWYGNIVWTDEVTLKHQTEEKKNDKLM
jgi:hypothetical protein